MFEKKCIVPSCTNVSKTHPKKIFLSVPKEKKRRLEWFEKIGVKFPLNSHSLYCCEDHFDLSTDAENWMYFKIIGTNLKLKRVVVPHRNLTAANATSQSQLTDSAKKKKLELRNSIDKKMNKVARDLFPSIVEKVEPEDVSFPVWAIPAVYIYHPQQTEMFLQTTTNSETHIQENHNDHQQFGLGSPINQNKILPNLVAESYNKNQDKQIQDSLNDSRYVCAKYMKPYKCKKCPRFQTNFLQELKLHYHRGHNNKTHVQRERSLNDPCDQEHLKALLNDHARGSETWFENIEVLIQHVDDEIEEFNSNDPQAVNFVKVIVIDPSDVSIMNKNKDYAQPRDSGIRKRCRPRILKPPPSKSRTINHQVKLK
ncbi:hypothetical protein Zmor_027351 [Zophobas morio]|uniref:THAP-type domain-containing protein n=2 Tax=Zophobas morio TaxID=2755281 RepID=A0AA38HQF0_9CUCU|nr:hypothetical protein Zmor_027351 [Zophobas morio]